MKCAFTLQIDDKSLDILVEAEPTETIGLMARYILENIPPDLSEANIINPTLLVNVGGKLVMHTPTSEFRDANIQNGSKVQLVSFIFDERVCYTSDIYGVLVDSQSGVSYPLIDGLEVGGGNQNDLQVLGVNQEDFDTKQFIIDLKELDDTGIARNISTTIPTRYNIQTDVISVNEYTFQISRFSVPIKHDRSYLIVNNWHNRYKLLPHLLEEENFESPKEPEKPQNPPLPIAMLVTPLIMGVVMYFIMPNPTMVLFMLMSPIMMLMNYVNTRTSSAKKNREKQDGYAKKRDEVNHNVKEIQKLELNILQKRYDTFNNVELWSKHFQEDDFLKINIGYGVFRSQIKLDGSVKQFEGMPYVIDLDSNIGIWGDNIYLTPFLGGLLLQIVRYYSPSELKIVIFAGKYSKDIEWLKWAQNVDLNYVAYSEESERRVLEAMINDSRLNGKYVLAIVIDICPENWHILENAISREGSKVRAIWISNTERQLSWCTKTRLQIVSRSKAMCSNENEHELQMIENYFTADAQYCEDFVKSIATLDDLSRTPDENILIPKSINLSQIIGDSPAKSTHYILESWSAKTSGLNCIIGMGDNSAFEIDIQKHGPHALVGGTTGAGKSEFLQTWVLSMALHTSPNRVNFLLVDYKGGAAFSSCVNLPHTVGLVTDLNIHLCKRVMISLKAELHRRELLLNEKRVKHLSELHELYPDTILPYLVIVVDEFAALAVDIPEFVDQIVDIAARGRSLGVHLIMATQRPSGVIKDNLKANTNLRIALRVADESESKDIIQNEMASQIKRETPGRFFVKIDTLTPVEVQCAYIGNTLDEKCSSIKVSDFKLVNGTVWGSDNLESNTFGESFLDLCVKQIQYAYMEMNHPRPYRPWKDQLQENITYSRNGGVAVIDKPHIQDQVEFYSSENILIYGKAGSGKTTALETWAMHNLLSNIQDKRGVYIILCTNSALNSTLSDKAEVIRLKDTEKMYRLFTGIINHSIQNSSVLIDGIDIFKEHFEQSNLYELQSLFNIMLAQSSSAKVQIVSTLSKVNGIYSNWSSNFTKQIYFALASENEYSYAGINQELLQQNIPGRGVLDGEEIQMKHFDTSVLSDDYDDKLVCTSKILTLGNTYSYEIGCIGIDVVSLANIMINEMVDIRRLRTVFIVGGHKSGKTSAVELIKQLCVDLRAEKSISICELDQDGESQSADSLAPELTEDATRSDVLQIVTMTPNALNSNWELKSQLGRADLCIILDANTDVASSFSQASHPSFSYCSNSPGRGFLVYENESRLVQLSYVGVK
ncbi:MAG: hypothetical protein LBC50_00840 [Candidatus Ancillula sp.]|jgi:S-DNA-T family DNA segregation ATPase FtsK/SpoIIIE|nr:hypothetical protein [Candidatus Ancillula sp.]